MAWTSRRRECCAAVHVTRCTSKAPVARASVGLLAWHRCGVQIVHFAPSNVLFSTRLASAMRPCGLLNLVSVRSPQETNCSGKPPSVPLRPANLGSPRMNQPPGLFPSRLDQLSAHHLHCSRNRLSMAYEVNASPSPAYADVASVPTIVAQRRITNIRKKQLIKAASRPFDDPPPPPKPDECCGSSCDPCVKTLWKEELACWRERWGSAAQEQPAGTRNLFSSGSRAEAHHDEHAWWL